MLTGSMIHTNIYIILNTVAAVAVIVLAQKNPDFIGSSDVLSPLLISVHIVIARTDNYARKGSLDF